MEKLKNNMYSVITYKCEHPPTQKKDRKSTHKYGSNFNVKNIIFYNFNFSP